MPLKFFIQNSKTHVYQICWKRWENEVLNYSICTLINFLLFLLLYRDRFRTTINVMCDALGAQIVDIMSKNDIKASNDLELERANADPTELVEIVKADDTRL